MPCPTGSRSDSQKAPLHRRFSEASSHPKLKDATNTKMDISQPLAAAKLVNTLPRA